jgi:hypothetical protein
MPRPESLTMKARVATIALTLLAAAPRAGAAEDAVSLRYIFRTGEVWREEATLTVEMLDASGTSLSRRTTSWVDRVEVVSVSTQGNALLRRTSGGEGPEREPLEVTISDRGIYRLPGDARPRARGMLASAVASRAPVLPEGPVAIGAARTRQIELRWEDTPFVVTETATLDRIEKTNGQAAAVIALRRQGRPAPAALTVEALASSPRGSLIAETRPARIAVDISGSSGTGVLRFDVATGRLVSYRAEETVGLSVQFGETALQRTGRITFSVHRKPARD